ncbi:MAG: hypothetical protein KatS3mg076_2623 [Candidatus Binatia bacterium]|nr:MAG: hypothetical protein KatS3mg076_2623 [Candidatus Binatia bacterium]
MRSTEELFEELERIGKEGRASPEEIDRIVRLLGDPRKAVQRRAAETLRELADRGVEVRPFLESALGNEPQRWAAAYGLALLGDARAVPVLLETLGSSDVDLRWAASALLTELGRNFSFVTEELVKVLDSGSPGARKMALYCLRDLGSSSPEILSRAVAALRDRDENVALAAISSLGRLGRDRPEAVAALLEVVRAGRPRLRRAAASALGRTHALDAETRVALEEAAGAEDPDLRRAAERALRQRGPKGDRV